MPNATKNKKLAPIICALVVIVIMVVYIAVMIYPLLEAKGNIALSLFFVVYMLMTAGIIVGVVIALRQRIKEINGGEEEEAKKY